MLYERYATVQDVIRPGEYSFHSVQSKIETAKACLQVESGQRTLEKRISRGTVRTDACGRSRQMGTSEETEEKKRCSGCSGRAAMEEENPGRASKDHATRSKGPREIQKYEMICLFRRVYCFYLQSFARILPGCRMWKSSRPLNIKVLRMAGRDRNRKIFLS
jgi:hypothetical protein